MCVLQVKCSLFARKFAATTADAVFQAYTMPGSPVRVSRP